MTRHDKLVDGLLKAGIARPPTPEPLEVDCSCWRPVGGSLYLGARQCVLCCRLIPARDSARNTATGEGG